MPGSTIHKLLLTTAMAAIPLAARATPPTQSTPDYAGQTAPFSGQQAEPGFATGLFGASRGNLLGDAFGLRTLLGQYGISLDVIETSELFGNATGGVNRGAVYTGLTTATLQLDTQRAFGWPGGTFNVSALQIHGRNFSADNLATLQTASGIEAERATRLWELWYDQSLLEGRLDFRIGQQSVDQEFFASAGSSLFINTMMGWPLLPSVDLYAGGPAYPLSSLGARVRVQPWGPFTVQAGIYSDNPPGGPFEDDSQVRGGEQSGAGFHTNTGAFIIGEVQYALNLPSLGQMDTNASAGLPGLYKIGGWYDTAAFPDQRYDTSGVSLADPDSNGIGERKRGNWSIYGVFDQTIWQPDLYANRAVGLFARIMGAPGDRNLADFSLNAGVTFKAPTERRNNDSIGLGFGIAKISGAASELDFATSRYGSPIPIRSSESFIELTYQAQIVPWWVVQPDFQYVFTPGGGIPDPNVAGQRVGNEAVFGIRTIVTF